MQMQPFVVDFEFASPICRESEYPIHLDALLAYAQMKELEEMGEADPWGASEDLSAYLAKTDSQEWCWKASWIKFEPLDIRRFVNTIRRSDAKLIYDALESGFWEPIGLRLAKYQVNSGSGQLRAYQWLLPIQWVRGKAWGVGNIEEVEYLLKSRISYIGKQGRNGYGRIKSITVSPASEGEALNWMYRSMSVVPERSPFTYTEMYATVRPPYWKKLNRIHAFEPIE